jgi:hypothetical protein
MQNIVQADKCLDPKLLQELINCLVLAFEGQSNFDHMQRLLLEEQQAAKLRVGASVGTLPVTQQPFSAPLNRYVENRGQVAVELPCCNRN